jgi:hypothetical protein
MITYRMQSRIIGAVVAILITFGWFAYSVKIYKMFQYESSVEIREEF